MPSLLPGYEYDIFISYRHNDNEYDRWVTTFVDALRRELSATFKEKLSIYFDENAQDGLHANHDVDDSLREKIRCLVFIPIISQTYCDPRSFAWTRELLAFRDFAINDDLGLKVKVAHANVSSRILPVRIHDIDNDDVRLYEKATGTVLRPIDFIFRSAGVNRPLSHQDDRHDNLNHTLYRDQINKVAIAVKEIITALKQSPAHPDHHQHVPGRKMPSTGSAGSFRRFLMPAVVVVLLAVIAFGAVDYFRKSAGVPTERLSADRSIAVLPFADMSAARDQEYFSDGLSEELLNLLAKIPSLKVISRTSAFSFKGKNEDIRIIGEKLGVAYVLEGSVRRSGDKMRITAQLINTSDGSHVWSETFDRDMIDIFKVQDEIAGAVVNELKGRLQVPGKSQATITDPVVYNLWLEARFFRSKLTVEGLRKGLELAERAYELDSTNALVLSELSRCIIASSNEISEFSELQPIQDRAQRLAERAVQLAPDLAEAYRAVGDVATFRWDMETAFSSIKKALDLDPLNDSYMSALGLLSGQHGDMDQASALIRKAIATDPLNARGHHNLAMIQLAEGDLERSYENALKAVSIAPSPARVGNLATVYMLLKQYDKALAEVPNIRDEFWERYMKIMIMSHSGRKDEVKEMFAKFREDEKETGPFQIAEIYAVQGMRDEAFKWIELSFRYKDPGLVDIKLSPFMNVYKDDPRYKQTVARLKLL